MVRISISQEVTKIWTTWRKLSSLSTRLIHDGNFVSESLQNIPNDIWVCVELLANSCPAPTHSALRMNIWLKINDSQPETAWSPESAPCDRFLYLNLEMTSNEGNLMTTLRFNNIAANFQTMHYIKCIQQWHKRWACWIKPQGHYTEGNIINLKVITVVMEN